MQPLQSGIISIPGSLKTRTWNQSPILAPKITENSQKTYRKWIPRASPNDPKINKNAHLDLQVPIG